MKHVFKIPEEYSFRKLGIKGKNFDTQELDNKAKFCFIETEKGHETKIRQKECSFYYFILEGQGNFEINGEIEECGQGELVIIPNRSIFRYSGTMKMLLITVPWWYPEQEETL